MAAMPLSLIGVILGLMVAGSTLNMFSMIGFIMLMGLVTKNGILLVDFANQERKRGLPLTEALINAGVVRFRPIIMTTLAMIVGMIPLALATTGGGAQRAPMAHAVIGGLISSTVLTLVVVPVILSYIDSLTRFIQPWLPKAPDDHGHGAKPAPQPDAIAQLHHDAPSPDAGEEAPPASWRKTLGLTLLGVVVLYWIAFPIIPFLNVPYKAAIIPGMIVLGEGLTLIVIALLGREYWDSIKA